MSKSNNPFAVDSQLNRTANRFPEINPEQSQQAQSPYQPQQHPQQQQQQQYNANDFSNQQQQQPMYNNPTGNYFSGQSHFNSQPPQTQNQPYNNYVPPQQNYGGNNTLDLDPYANLSSSSSFQSPPSASNSSSNHMTGIMQATPTMSHPKQYVRESNAALSSFDEYAWKQLLNRVDAVRVTWEERKTSLLDARMKGADYERVEEKVKEADNYIDSIHASKFQLSEVQAGWRHSTDAASKARVREALNAGITSLPDFPAPLDIQSLSLSQSQYQQSQQNDLRKSSIMSGFQPQSQFGQQQHYSPSIGGGMGGGGMGISGQQGMMQNNMTGYGGGGMMNQQPTGYQPQQFQPQQQPQQQQQQYQQNQQQQFGNSQQQYYQ